MLFARFETEFVRSSGTKSQGPRRRQTDHVHRIPAGFDAKNRFNLPFVMPLDWKTFGDAIRDSPTYAGQHALRE